MLLIMILLHLNSFGLSDVERKEGQGVPQLSESKTKHDVPALSTVFSYTGHEGYFLFEIAIQAPEATKLKSAASFVFLASYIFLPVICLRGTETLSPEMSVKIFM